MKNYFLLITLVFLVFTACNKTDDGPTDNGVVDANANYKITTYTQNAIPFDTVFKNYTFKFALTGILEASNAGYTHNGKWAITNDTFRITNLPVVPVSNLNKFWLIKSINSAGINLVDSSTTNYYHLVFSY